MDQQTHDPAPGAAPPDPEHRAQDRPHDGPHDGPRTTRAEVRDFTRLRRSSTDRHVAGVAGGIARHLDVDPTLVRVVLAVLVLFGGAGLLVYAAVWLFVPEDGRDRAPLDLGPEVGKVAVLVAAVLAAAVVLGVPWVGTLGPLPWLLLLALGIAWLVTRGRRDTVPPSVASYGVSAAPSEAPADPRTGDAPAMAGPPAPPHPATPSSWGPPPPPLPPRPRRSGPVLFWPTLAVIALGLGVLGMVDVSASVPVSAYAALALGTTGLALLVGAFRGRPGGLIALGLVGVLALGATSVADGVRAFGPYSQVTARPDSAAAILATDGGTYLPDSGDFTLDLSRVGDLDALDGRTISVQMDVGELSVVLPRGTTAEVDGTLRYAGEVRVDDRLVVSGAGNQQGVATLDGNPGGPTVRLELQLGVGQIDVTHTTAAPGADR